MSRVEKMVCRSVACLLYISIAISWNAEPMHDCKIQDLLVASLTHQYNHKCLNSNALQYIFRRSAPVWCTTCTVQLQCNTVVIIATPLLVSPVLYCTSFCHYTGYDLLEDWRPDYSVLPVVAVRLCVVPSNST
jgi:hypothetical protein